ncbi:MAG: hypothetical protein TR69_WS6001001068 [candidate division WS6 bacterium OLB20]|uniref:GIY-YIG domain-containing protein n=1 Tax=candidate division WS6 bacterium OLB20 TaxID=1617426 RepID=A0A136LZG5_9BACT|nr:MAG: hypothetical protein TR69_WS6001001068 [candidate division WS6 bacterium OLB20]
MQTLLIPLNKTIIKDIVPDSAGVFYLHGASIFPIMKVGMAHDGNLRERLLEEYDEFERSEVTHFSFMICSSDREAILIAEREIELYEPRYNSEQSPRKKRQSLLTMLTRVTETRPLQVSDIYS